MVVRVAALAIAVARTAFACFAVVGSAVVASADPDPFSPLAVRADTAGAFAADPALLHALDDLLMDPVRLVRGDLERLRVLPWLGADDLVALAAALPITSAAELESRAGWTRTAVQRTAPFLRFAPQPTPFGVTARSGRRRSAIGIVHADVRAALQVGRAPASGSIEARRSGLGSAAGDVRIGFGQGLLVWTSRSGLDVGTALVRRAPGLVPAATRGGLRGAGLEWLGESARATMAAGHTPAGLAAGVVTFGRRFGAVWLGAIAAELDGRAGASLEATQRRRATRLATEVAWAAPRSTAAAIALEHGDGALQLGLRLHAQHGLPFAWAGLERDAGSAHGAHARAAFETTRGRGEIEAMHTTGRGTGGTRSRRWAIGAGGDLVRGRRRIGAEVVRRERETQRPDAGGEAVRTTRSFAATATAAQTTANGWVVHAEARWRGFPNRLDRAWQVAAVRSGPNRSLALSLASFVARRRWALPLPGAGDADGAGSVAGDGARLAATTHLVWRGVAVRAAAALVWADARRPEPRADATLALGWGRSRF